MSKMDKLPVGEWYRTGDPDILRQHYTAQDLCRTYNALSSGEEEKKQEILLKIFGSLGEDAVIEQPFYAAYGVRICAGNKLYINSLCYIMDDAPVIFGDHVRIGPQCGFYTAEHPFEVAARRDDMERAQPIRIGNDVWIGGGCRILGVVTIGDGSVIGAGSVVTHDIPAGVLACGVPCRVIRNIV